MHIEVRDISRRYRSILAVDQLSFDVRSGEVLGLLGPNGSGKSTTIRMLLGLLRPDAGTIVVDGVEGGHRSLGRRGAIGWVPEERGLYDDYTVEQMLHYLARLHGLAPAEARPAIQALLEDGGLADRAHTKIGKLSKGLGQKVQLMGALVHQPGLVVLDEPFTGLDAVSTHWLKGLVRRLADEGRAVLLSSHRLTEVEAVCDRVCIIANGQRVRYGTLDELRASGAPAEGGPLTLEEVYLQSTSR